jgi:polyhydroxyalkanoate synthesis repressor PhaR
MIRLIKRYGGGSRKLYDTEESRYVGLDEIATWVRRGQELKVVDSASGDDVTAQTLAQVIYETHRTGTALLSTDFLHDAIRKSGQAISERARKLQSGVDRLVRQSVSRLPGAQAARSELDQLRVSLETLQKSVASLEKAAGPRIRRNARKGRKNGHRA